MLDPLERTHTRAISIGETLRLSPGPKNSIHCARCSKRRARWLSSGKPRNRCQVRSSYSCCATDCTCSRLQRSPSLTNSDLAHAASSSRTPWPSGLACHALVWGLRCQEQVRDKHLCSFRPHLRGVISPSGQGDQSAFPAVGLSAFSPPLASPPPSKLSRSSCEASHSARRVTAPGRFDYLGLWRRQPELSTQTRMTGRANIKKT